MRRGAARAVACGVRGVAQRVVQPRLAALADAPAAFADSSLLTSASHASSSLFLRACRHDASAPERSARVATRVTTAVPHRTARYVCTPLRRPSSSGKARRSARLGKAASRPTPAAARSSGVGGAASASSPSPPAPRAAPPRPSASALQFTRHAPRDEARSVYLLMAPERTRRMKVYRTTGDVARAARLDCSLCAHSRSMMRKATVQSCRMRRSGRADDSTDKQISRAQACCHTLYGVLVCSHEPERGDAPPCRALIWPAAVR